MVTQTTQNSPSDACGRGNAQSMTDMAQPNIQLVMTYRGSPSSVDIDEGFAGWLDAKCADLGVCALSVLVACAEMVRELE